VTAIPPIHREVLVDADPATAFEIFTAQIGHWWPLGDHGVYGADATVAFVDGQIVESSATGETNVWGTVTRWETAVAVAFTWHPGQAAERASRVEVSFAPADAQTLVTLEHTGWEDAYDDPQAARDEYEQGWPHVLDQYRRTAVRA
jgi:Activator of Hsp90 ATPase homolog 1-like protein